MAQQRMFIITVVSSDEPLCYPAFATQQEKAGSDACRIVETEMRLGDQYFRSWTTRRTGSTQPSSHRNYLKFRRCTSTVLFYFLFLPPSPSRYTNGPSILLDHSLSLCLPPGNLRYSYRIL